VPSSYLSRIDLPLAFRRLSTCGLAVLQEMIESLRVARPAFAYDDYKSLLSLQLGIDQAPPKEVDGSTAALQGDRKAFNSHLIDLMSIMQADD
jgi:hypothetical protein